MKIILITGLDGSGKSTILKNLNELKGKLNAEVIFLPFIDSENYTQDIELYKAVEFVNFIGREADQSKSILLKTVAIFSSMLLYEKLLSYKFLLLPKVIFIERHPLIDSLVYAKFYLSQRAVRDTVIENFDEINMRFSKEINYLSGLLPNQEWLKGKKGIEGLAYFVRKWFVEEKKTGFQDLSVLFRTNLPDELIFLRADADVLFKRINNREVKEAHEKVEVLQNLGYAYDKILKQVKEIYSCTIHIVDANKTENLDVLSDKLLNQNL